jgi:hypothetical protein
VLWGHKGFFSSIGIQAIFSDSDPDTDSVCIYLDAWQL